MRRATKTPKTTLPDQTNKPAVFFYLSGLAGARAFVLIFAFLFLQQDALWAGADDRKYAEKGDQSIELIQRIYGSYSIHILKKEMLEELLQEWRAAKISANLIPNSVALMPAAITPAENQSTSSTAKSSLEFTGEPAHRPLPELYRQIDLFLRDACIDLANYSEYLQDDFSRINSAGNLPRHDGWLNAWSVSRQEFARAQKAFLAGQYFYAAHLYDRSIRMLDQAYRLSGASASPGWDKVRSEVAAPAAMPSEF